MANHDARRYSKVEGSLDTKVIAAIAFGLFLFAVVAMAGMHEKHYRDRRGRISQARMTGIEHRLATVEEILTEDRIT